MWEDERSIWWADQSHHDVNKTWFDVNILRCLSQRNQSGTCYILSRHIITKYSVAHLFPVAEDQNSSNLLIYIIHIYIRLYIIWLSLWILAEEPKQFDNRNLKAPHITNLEGSVDLLCTVELLNGIEKYHNVEYLITWFADKKPLTFNTTRCGQQDEMLCPDPEKNITSKLTGKEYTAGKWVRNKFIFFF